MAILKVTSTDFHDSEVYLFKLFAILKVNRFLILRYSYEEITIYSSDIEIDNLDFDNFSRLELALKNQQPLSRLSLIVNQFIIRGTRTPIN